MESPQPNSKNYIAEKAPGHSQPSRCHLGTLQPDHSGTLLQCWLPTAEHAESLAFFSSYKHFGHLSDDSLIRNQIGNKLMIGSWQPPSVSASIRQPHTVSITITPCPTHPAQTWCANALLAKMCKSFAASMWPTC